MTLGIENEHVLKRRVYSNVSIFKCLYLIRQFTTRGRRRPSASPLTRPFPAANISSVLKEFRQGLSRLIYPPHCLLCRKFSPTTYATPLKGFVCPACQEKILLNKPPFCARCSRYLEENAQNSRCRECAKTDPAFDFAWSACLYTEPLKTLIHAFKYGQKTGLRHLFIDLMASFIRTYGLDIAQFDIIVPIPLSPTRLRERGYNQARLLGEGMAREFSLPLSVNHLIRRRHTQPQTLLDEKERWTNMEGAFTIEHSKILKQRNILIVDDLLTTGATASEAARTLKEAGAGTVGVLALAITAERS